MPEEAPTIFGCARFQTELLPGLVAYCRSNLLRASPSQPSVTSPLVMTGTFAVVSGGLGNLFDSPMPVNCGEFTGALLAVTVTKTMAEVFVAPRLSVATAVRLCAPTTRLVR